MKRVLLNKALVILLSMIVIILSGCSYKSRMLQYYSEISNYEELEGIILNFEEIKGEDDLFIEIEFENEKIHDHYLYHPLRVMSKNKEVLKKNGFFENVSIGDKIKIVTASRYFYDGYRIPIVAIECDNIVYLDFQTGRENLLKWVEEPE